MDWIFSNKINSNALQKGSGDTPLLDGDGNSYYEEQGTWEPNLGAYDFSFTSNGFYIAQGRLVTCIAQFSITDTNDNSQIRITQGFPYPIAGNWDWGGRFTKVQTTVNPLVRVESTVFVFNRDTGGNFRYSDLGALDFSIEFRYIKG